MAADPDPRRRRVRRPGRRGRVPGHVATSSATASAAPSTSSSTTRSASPPRPQFARSSPYCTDVAKMLQAPIFHVNGDDPEACVRVAALAFEYRQRFHKDVVIDMVCYRRHGHNEGDDPSYTQPLMYKAIGERRSVRKLFVEALVNRGELTLEEAEETLADFQHRLQVALDETRQSAPAPSRAAKPPAPHGRAAPRRHRRRPRRRSTRSSTTSPRTRDGFTPAPEAGPAVRDPREAVPRGGRGGVGDGRGRWPSARWCWRAPTSAWPARTAAAARSASATPRLIDYETRQAVDAAQRPARRHRPSSGSTTRCCRSTPPSATSTATRSPTRTRSCCGRRSSATS